MWRLTLAPIIILTTGLGWHEWAVYHGQQIDLWQAVLLGAPAWILLVPGLSVLSLAVLGSRQPGGFSLIFALGLPAVIVNLASLLTFQSAQGFVSHGGGVWSLLGTLTYPLMALVLANYESVPLSAPLARLSYFGRYDHLQGICRLAEQRGWLATGPLFQFHDIFVEGAWSGRRVLVHSSARFSLFRSDLRGCRLRVELASKRTLWSMVLAIGLDGPGNEDQRRALRGSCVTADGKMHTFFVIPTVGRTGSAALPLLEDSLSDGAPFLRNRTRIVARHDALIFEKVGLFQMTETEQDVKEIIRWLAEIAQAMEDGGLSDDPTAESGLRVLQ